MAWRTNRKTGNRFPSGMATPRELTTRFEGVPATFYETSRTHRDPLEAWNELVRSAEDELGTSRHAETGEIYANSDDGLPIDLGNQSNYPSNFDVQITIPDRNNRLWNLSGRINRAKGGWRAGAELEEVE